MYRISIYLAAVLLFIAGVAIAQDTIYFDNGLIVGSTGRSGRSVISKDPVFYNLITGNFNPPIENDSVGVGYKGDVQRWQKITADKKGLFSNPKLRGGYIYLTYNSPHKETRVLDVSGHSEIFVNGVARGGDVYNNHWVLLPVSLKKGINTFFAKGGRKGRLDIKLLPVKKSICFTTTDMTNPDLIVDEDDTKVAAIKILNSTSKTQTGLKIVSEVNGVVKESKVPTIIPMTSRKVPCYLQDYITDNKVTELKLKLYNGAKLIDETNIKIYVKKHDETYKRTFISDIDGSVQFFAVREGDIKEGVNPAMFLSLHGAGVNAKRQAKSYKPKDWGHVIAPTNRREFGFDWEDWGRWDAMEVQAIAQKIYNTDPKHTYLTGHSMGGHGTWQLGVTFPGMWAAISPLAGWYSFFSYSNKEKIEDPSPVEKMFVRSSHSSNTLELSKNYIHHGIYIQHGDSDKNVPVGQARFMREHLSTFHPDFAYLEYQGKPHWFGVNHSTIFDYFKWHKIPDNSDVKSFEFRTASPGVSASSRYVTLYRQESPFKFCGVLINQNISNGKGKDELVTNRLITVETENLEIFKLDLAHCLDTDIISVKIDDDIISDLALHGGQDVWFSKVNNCWKQIDKPTNSFEKNPVRYGNFKDAFKHNMLFVYSTKGNKAENEWSFNKARFDAETFYYRGNGSIDVIPDKEFTLDKYRDRSVILYGNATTNGAWDDLLSESPVQVERGEVRVGEKVIHGDDYGLYFIRPRMDSDKASVGVISGSGMKGFNAVNPNKYFVSGVGIPDLMIFTTDIYKNGFDGVKAAGYFGNDWTVENGEIEWQVD